jgi:hypothetical protein
MGEQNSDRAWTKRPVMSAAGVGCRGNGTFAFTRFGECAEFLLPGAERWFWSEGSHSERSLDENSP